jgi:hypothetical protein
MTTPAEAAKKTVEIGKKHILDQQLRIVRQRGLIGMLEQDGHPETAADARRLLAEMERLLAQMEADHSSAQERLSQAAVDEPSLANVEKDTPL